MGTDKTLLQIQNLSVEFSGFKALTDVNIQVEKGQILVIIGPNGAGKTTLLDLITGKTKPASGKIIFDGDDITGKRQDIIASKYHIGRKFQGPNVFENMSAYQNIMVAAAGYQTVAGSLTFHHQRQVLKKTKEILNMINLYEKRHIYVGELSHGERQWLEIGMVIAQEPRLIVLDEPTAGMTAAETYKTGMMIKELFKEQTVIVIEHDMDFVKQIAEEVVVLHQGRVLAEGIYEEIEKDPKVIEVYLKDTQEDMAER